MLRRSLLIVMLTLPVLFGLTVPAWADAARPGDPAVPVLSPEVLRLIAENPRGVARLCEDVISGYGGPGGLDAEGVQGAIGLLRADARSDLMRRLWATDLDGDGAVMQGELEIAMRAMSAGQRARAIRLHELADVDGDDTVSPAEMRLAAEAAALARLGDDEAGLLRALMAFDADANGLVTRQEMRGGLAALHLDQGT